VVQVGDEFVVQVVNRPSAAATAARGQDAAPDAHLAPAAVGHGRPDD
jgi:hypothetical protein